ncbi:MAG: hypothetical protein GYB31_20735 [Bacteroidetes bacterium]|nr:hypothetical protein [Bacteroidota bacterium]
MKKFLKWTGIILGSLLLIALIAGIIINQPLPDSTEGPEADALANEMLAAINKTNWDSTGYVAWTFAGMHHYKWDRKRNWAEVSWKDNKVLIDLDEVDGLAFANDARLEGEEARKMIDKAWAFYCNDSFWFIAPYKVFDPGTRRSIVTNEDGTKSLMITYESGGVTPGDSYLWHLNTKRQPTSWQMWVNVLPIGGLQMTWEDWQPLSTGALVAHTHKNKLATLQMTNIEGAKDIREVFPNKDPFAALETEPTN